jgi:hypothetical protein
MNRKQRAREAHQQAAGYFLLLFLIGCFMAAPFHPPLWAIPIVGLVFVLIAFFLPLVRGGKRLHH